MLVKVLYVLVLAICIRGYELEYQYDSRCMLESSFTGSLSLIPLFSYPSTTLSPSLLCFLVFYFSITLAYKFSIHQDIAIAADNEYVYYAYIAQDLQSPNYFQAILSACKLDGNCDTSSLPEENIL